MDDDKILQITGEIEETLGKDSFAMISDKIGELMTGNTQNMQAIAELKKENENLLNRNEKLVSANGALLQKIPMEKAENPYEKEDKKEAPKTINLRSVFDKHGRFKK